MSRDYYQYKEWLKQKVDHLNKCYPDLKFQVRDYSGTIRVVIQQGQNLVASNNYRETLALLRAWIIGWNMAIDMDIKTPSHVGYRSK